MVARNSITGDAIQTKTATESYRDGWDRIFGNKKSAVPDVRYDVPVSDDVTQKEDDHGRDG